MRKTIIIAALAVTACSDPVTPDVSPSLRYARPVSSASNITVQSLGTLPYTGTLTGAAIGMALNNGASRSLTRVAGYTPYQTTRDYPFTWTLASGMQPLQTIDAGYGWPAGVSDGGAIVGEMARFGGIGNRAFIVTADEPMTYLPIPADTKSSRASGISADGTCISGSFSNNAGAWFAVVWRNGVLDTLGLGSATGVSSDCTVISGNVDGHGAAWRMSGADWVVEQVPPDGKGVLTESGDSLYNETTDISPNGLYMSGTRRSSKGQYAEVWRFDGKTWVATDLPGGTPYAFGVDNSGRAVGHNAKGEPVVWTRSSTGTYTAQVLPGLERSTQGWPASINEMGQVSGRSKTAAGWVAVIWTIN